MRTTFIPWRRVEERPDVRNYLAAFDAWLAAGGRHAPAVVTGLKQVAFVDLIERRR